MRILFAWLGATDLNASRGTLGDQPGPIRAVVEARPFERIVLLSNYKKGESKDYVAWLSKLTDAPVVLDLRDLTSPTDFAEIHEAVVEVVERELRQAVAGGAKVEPVFHLSPGTPAMAAVWIILAKTRFAAELVESSLQAGVRTVSFPFEMSAEFLPDLLRKPDAELERLQRGLPPEAPGFTDIVHRSPEMKKVVAQARKIAVRSVSVLIEGESGTGKELFARAIHEASPRAGKPFVAVNCGAIPGELVDAELFGHEEGAFTGAVRDRAGHFETAHGGTLFLDEIGELPLHAQVKLLRVLQEGTVMRVGSSKATPVDVRVLAATNRNLRVEMDAGRFRADLYHRIAVGFLRLPPLRERRGDLGVLINHLLEQINREAAGQPGYREKRLSAGARNLLMAQPWTGNVRELRNALARASLWAEAEVIGTEDVRGALGPDREAAGAVLGRALGSGFRIQEVLDEVARHYLQRALEEAGGNRTRAAELVGLASYQTFVNWMGRYGVARTNP